MDVQICPRYLGYTVRQYLGVSASHIYCYVRKSTETISNKRKAEEHIISRRATKLPFSVQRKAQIRHWPLLVRSCMNKPTLVLNVGAVKVHSRVDQGSVLCPSESVWTRGCPYGNMTHRPEVMGKRTMSAAITRIATCRAGSCALYPFRVIIVAVLVLYPANATKVDLVGGVAAPLGNQCTCNSTKKLITYKP